MKKVNRLLIMGLSISMGTGMIYATDITSLEEQQYTIQGEYATQSYVTRDPVYDLNDSSVNRAESEHFQIIWGNGDTTGTVNRQFVLGNLENLENIRTFYLDKLGMGDPATSTSTYFGNTKYKTNVYIAATGLEKIETDWAYMSVDKDGFGYVVMAPGAMRVDPPSWVVPHEYAHVVTYHQGGNIPGEWYESIANWYRDQYLGSEYYKYGNNVYGPASDFFAPVVLNSNLYFPHLKNWYDDWAILLYITENPDQVDGLGLELMQKLVHNNQSGNMFEVLEKLSGQPIKDILGYYARRMVTMDYKRQDSYLSFLNQLLEESSNRSKIYTTLQQESDGWLHVSDERAPQQGGYNIVPLSVDLSKKVVEVDFKGKEGIEGADWRVSIVAKTKSGETRYSTMWSNGINNLNLQGDESEIYLVVCATPDKMNDLEVFNENATGTKYPYAVKVAAKDRTDVEEGDKTGLSLSIKNTSGAITSTIAQKYQVTASDEKQYDLSKLTIRYYYTAESAAVQTVSNDHSAISYNVAPWYVDTTSLTKAKSIAITSSEDADHYIEISFNTMEIYLNRQSILSVDSRLYNQNWSNYNQVNDYSYNKGPALFYEGKLISGSVPR
ncbi:DUF6055 domain-containing protein [Cellulosilyticum sp. ST5]|uniref:DUF6055 domain-containing protein n=1 Tax=Cellulosilyticum sp. ST5 TaxID=3055805 RepID=UPI003977730A